MSDQLVDLVCFGELLWDNLPSGKVAGGAPFNIINRATALGLRAEVVASVGDDPLGEELLDVVKSKGNSISFIQKHADLPTSVVNVLVGEGGEPHYEIVYPVAWDDVKIDDEVIDLVKGSRSFVYSSLGLRDERSREALFSLLPHASLKICDVNLRDGHFEKETILRMIEHADVLRMNETELEMVSDWLGVADLERREQMAFLQEKYNYKLVIATLGGEGAVCYADGQWHVQPVMKVEVQDTVGAGDAFLASFIFKYLSEAPLALCLKYACAVGGITASKSGGTPHISHEEIDEMMTVYG